MIIDKTADKDNIQIITNKFNELVENNISTDEILVLVSTASDKKKLINSLPYSRIL